MVSQGDRSDELSWRDLEDLGIRILRLFYQMLRFFFGVWRRQPWLSALCIGVGAAFFTGLLFQRSKEYRMTTTLVYGELHPKIYGDMIDKLNRLLQNGETRKAAGLMQLSPAFAEQITGIAVSDSRGKPLTTNYTMLKEPILLTVRLKAPIPEDTLKAAMISYLNGNPFTADRLELRKRLLREEMAYIKGKLRTVDSILSNLYARSGKAPADQAGITIESSEGKNASELLAYSRDLLARKHDIEYSLVNPENVLAIDNSLILPRARFTTANILKYGLAGGALGYFIAAMMVLWREKLKEAVGSTS